MRGGIRSSRVPSPDCSMLRRMFRELSPYSVCMFRVLSPVFGLYNSLPYTASAAIAGREVVFRWPRRGLQRPGRILTAPSLPAGIKDQYR